MPLPLAQHFPLMALTQEGLPWSHAEQARRLCAGGARWIQLRVKQTAHAEWLGIAREVVAICRGFDAVCIVNDSVEIAREAGAHGVHLGKLDLDWRRAREQLGEKLWLGGTVNNQADASLARTYGCLDYAGVGPWRFTANKQNLAPILGPDGVHALIGQLAPLPAWIIGGIELVDLGAARETGAAGVAVSSALFRGGMIEANTQAFLAAWPHLAPTLNPTEPPPSQPKDRILDLSPGSRSRPSTEVA